MEGECLALGPGVEHFSGVRSVEDCQDLCWQQRQTCNYFTFYNQSASQGLSSTCHLFPVCELLQDCRGCETGPASCDAQCSLPADRGGHWFCDHHSRDITTAPTYANSLEKCYFLCEEKNLQELTCFSGKWSLDMALNSHKLACKMRVVEGDDTSQESLAVVITVGVVAGLAIITLTIALVNLFRTHREDTKPLTPHTSML